MSSVARLLIVCGTVLVALAMILKAAILAV